MTRPPHPPLRVTSIRMADGSDPASPQAQARIARALLTIPQPPAQPQPGQRRSA